MHIYCHSNERYVYIRCQISKFCFSIFNTAWYQFDLSPISNCNLNQIGLLWVWSPRGQRDPSPHIPGWILKFFIQDFNECLTSGLETEFLWSMPISEKVNLYCSPNSHKPLLLKIWVQFFSLCMQPFGVCICVPNFIIWPFLLIKLVENWSPGANYVHFKTVLTNNHLNFAPSGYLTVMTLV